MDLEKWLQGVGRSIAAAVGAELSSVSIKGTEHRKQVTITLTGNSPLYRMTRTEVKRVAQAMGTEHGIHVGATKISPYTFQMELFVPPKKRIFVLDTMTQDEIRELKRASFLKANKPE